MIARILSLTEVHAYLAKQGYGILKFVRVGDEYRFAMTLDGPEHKDMLNKGEVVKSAGFCTFDYEEKTANAKGESMSLHIGIAKDDSEKIAALIYS